MCGDSRNATGVKIKMRLKNRRSSPTEQAKSNLNEQFWLCTSSALSIAIALSVAPVYAEDELPASHDSTPKLNQEFVHSTEALKQVTSSFPDSVTKQSTEARHLTPVAPASLSNTIAQTEAPTAQPSESFSRTTAPDRWQFSVEPYFFVPLSVKADATVAGRTTSIDLGLGSILNFDRAFDAGIRVEAQKDRLGLIFDGFYVSAKDSGNLGVTFPPGSLPGIGANIPIPVRASADASLSIRQGVIDLAAAYRVVDTTLGDSTTKRFPRLFVDPIVGLRTNILSQELEVGNVRLNNIPVSNLPLPISLPVNQDFRSSRTTVEPLIGARIGLDLSERWTVGIRGDVSGFNLYADTNLTWNLLIGTQYQLSPNTSLRLSYRFNNFDFEDGSGLSRTKLNLRQNGLLLGATFRF